MPDTESFDNLTALRVDLARAVVASVVARHAELQPSPKAGPLPSTPDGPVLVLSPSWPLGYPLTGELLALEQLSLQGPEPGGGAEASGQSGLSREDLVLSGVTAFLFDRLVNPVLGPVLTAPAPTEAVPADRVYGQALRRATFAGDVLAASPQWSAAEALLFRTGADGSRARSAVYETYVGYSERVREARDRLEALGAGAGNADREEAQLEVDRLEAEWTVLGRRPEVEAALRVLAGPPGETFEDERLVLLRRLEAMQRARLDQVGENYCLSQLAPLAPLLTDAEDATGWRRVDLDADQVRASLHPGLAEAYGLAGPTLETVLDGLRRLTLDSTVVFVVRDWLDPAFFTARYWRLPADAVLSDGVGGGELPGYASRLLFVRSATVEYADGLLAEFAGEPAATRRVPRVVRLQPELVGDASVAKALEVAQVTGLERAARALRSERTELAAPPPAASAAPPAGSVAPFAASFLSGPIADRARILRRAAGRASGAPTARARGRVRDHRTGGPSGGPVVRDHRTEGGSSVPPPRPVRFDVAIRAADPDLLGGLSVRLATDSGTDVSVPLRLGPTGVLAGRASTRLAVPAVVTAVLQSDEAVLDQRRTRVTGSELELSWEVTESLVRLELIPSAIPTLFGYGVTVVPACPDPDPGLAWT